MAEIGRGEIWMFAFPRPDKRRPVLVLTRPESIPYLDAVTVAPITTTIRGVPSEVKVGEEAGLKRPSAINLHHLATVPKAGLRSFVGTVRAQTLLEVREALLFSLGFAGAPSRIRSR
jgi:mRNA interferase MazF